jgi:hypothetical protein
VPARFLAQPSLSSLKQLVTAHSNVGQFLLLSDWLLNYQKDWLRPDVIAGLTTAAVVIPKAMAYATIAGLLVVAY